MENQNSLPVLPKKNFKNTKGKKRPEKGTKRLKLKKKKNIETQWRVIYRRLFDYFIPRAKTVRCWTRKNKMEEIR